MLSPILWQNLAHSTLSMPLTVPKDYRLFIEVNVLGCCECIAGFNPYGSGVIEEKMKCAGYWRHLQSPQSLFMEKSIITP